MDPEELRRRVGSTTWYHSIDLPHGIVTPGSSTNTALSGDELPDLAGRTVLDIGAWDGLYSFRAERMGAKRVVALDHYAWCLDWGAREAYWQEGRSHGTLPDSDRDLRDFWRPDAPGRRGFDIAHEALGSHVEPVIGDFMTMDPAELGSFDVVLFLGVLYHVKEPLRALERLRRLTGEVLVLETEAVHVEGYENDGLMQFLQGGELRDDYTNWYVPTEAALRGLGRAAGFSRVDVKRRAPSSPPQATRRGRRGLQPSMRYYRAVVHAFP